MQPIIANNLPNIKLANQSFIRQMVYHHSPISRRDIAKSLSLTLPTITTTVSLLLEKGLLRETEDTPSTEKKLGRKTSLLETVSDSRYFMGIEMRGTKRRLCVTDYCGNILLSAKDNSPYPDYEENIAVTCGMVNDLLGQLGNERQKLSGIGICVPGLVDRAIGELNTHPGYGWKQKPIVRDVRRLTGYEGPISLENNTCARAYGAYLFHQGLVDRYTSFAYFYVSSGIACPIMSLRSRFQETIIGNGEVGHMVMNTNGPVCDCGNRGCLEAYSSEKAILLTCRKQLQEGRMPILRELCKNQDASQLTIQEVLLAQENGDMDVHKVLSDAVVQLGVAIANVDNLIRPDCFLIEGHLFDTEANRNLLIDTVRQNLYTVTNASFDFHFMEYNSFSGALGAAAVAVQQDLNTYVE